MDGLSGEGGSDPDPAGSPTLDALDRAWGRSAAGRPTPGPAAPRDRGRTVRLVDTTVRDGQGSLWATSMRTRHMVAVLPDLDRAGFAAMEFLAPGSRFRKLARELGENPWDWIVRGARCAERTPLRWHGTIDTEVMSGRVPPEVGELLIERIVALGIRETRFGSNWNDFSGLTAELARYERLGMRPVVSLMYSVSPKHTDEYYVARARDLARHGAPVICLKDVSGLLTPEQTRRLVPRLLAETPGIPWEFHAHCNSGLGPLNAIEAVRAGIRTIHTAVPPLADGSSQPSVLALAQNLRDLGWTVDVDLEPLSRVERTLDAIAAVEGLPRGAPAAYRVDHYLHQVPGGMISNLRHQLAGAGLADRLPEVLEEIVRVRADFGYPIMVTPLSQFVGSQAAVNVMTGARYEVVTDASIEFALGFQGGTEAVDGMDPDVRDRILSRPRAAVVAAQRAEPLPDLATIRRRLGPGVPDEDLILLAIMGDDALDGIPSFRELDLDRPLPDPPLLTAVRAALVTGGPRGISVASAGLRIHVERTEVGAR